VIGRAETLGKRAAIFGFLYSARGLRRALVSSPRTAGLLRPGFEAALWRLGKWRVWLLFEDARKKVPAYRILWEEHDRPEVTLDGLDPDLSVLPVTDKESYVRRFTIEERCRDGRIPSKASSSTSPRERAAMRTTGFAARRNETTRASCCT
jgi:phenylacetate-CoA ligase